jgi:hypothetical protein
MSLLPSLMLLRIVLMPALKRRLSSNDTYRQGRQGRSSRRKQGSVMVVR